MSTFKKSFLKGLLLATLLLCPFGSKAFANESVKIEPVSTRFEFGVFYGYPYSGPYYPYAGYPYGYGYYYPPYPYPPYYHPYCGPHCW